jgi:hypothetical protein
MLDLRDARIAYAPFTPSCDRPGDLRRYCYYARRRQLRFDLADPSENYDIVIVSAGADISIWSRYYGRNAKVVYDLTDSYLAIPKLDPKGLLRGLAKFVTRQNKRLLWTYAGGIREMCDRANAVICTTAEQQRDILPHCGNVHIILDFQGSVVRSVKTSYSSGDIFNIVWEGLAGNLGTLEEIIDVLCQIRKERPIAIHAVTNLSYGQYLNGRFAQRRTEDLARKMKIHPYLYAWNEQTCSAVVCACDLAVIPIPLQDPLYAGKPENKLHLFWRMGMPTVVSATPAYTRAMQESGLSMACATSQDWREILEEYVGSEESRRSAGRRGKKYVDTHHSEESMLARWDKLFASIFVDSGHLPNTKAAFSESPSVVDLSANRLQS